MNPKASIKLVEAVPETEDDMISSQEKKRSPQQSPKL
jgi:hypothetical protein